MISYLFRILLRGLWAFTHGLASILRWGRGRLVRGNFMWGTPRLASLSHLKKI